MRGVLVLFLAFACIVANAGCSGLVLHRRRDLHLTKRLAVSPKPLHLPNSFDGFDQRIVALRAGSLSSPPLKTLVSSPSVLFNGIAVAVSSAVAILKLTANSPAVVENEPDQCPEAHSGTDYIKWKFLSVFWFIRFADWLQGPYFMTLYASKSTASTAAHLIAPLLFVTGFASSALFSPFLGQFVDIHGRKLGTLLGCTLSGLGCLSTVTTSMWSLAMGRVLGGIGSALLACAPEHWLVDGYQQRKKRDSRQLSQVFSLAYSVDALLAIAAGFVATQSVQFWGLTGPFLLSAICLGFAVVITLASWEESTTVISSTVNPQLNESWMKFLKGVSKNKALMSLGISFALFESAMYIFVMEWPALLATAVRTSHLFPSLVDVPYGHIFSLFMTCCLLGSTIWSRLSSRAIEKVALALCITATFSLAGLAYLWQLDELLWTISLSGVFELCCGLYFPTAALMRSRFTPSHAKSRYHLLFGIPVSVVVCATSCLGGKVSTKTTLSIAAAVLALASVCLMGMQSTMNINGGEGSQLAER